MDESTAEEYWSSFKETINTYKKTAVGTVALGLTLGLGGCTPDTPRQIDGYDLDQDGHNDVAVLYREADGFMEIPTSNVYVRTDTTIDYPPITSGTLEEVSTHEAKDVMLGDVDGDGDFDLAKVYDELFTVVKVHENIGDSTAVFDPDEETYRDEVLVEVDFYSILPGEQ